MMQDKEIKAEAIKAFLDIGNTVEVPILPKNKWEAILQRIGVKKKVLSYTLKKIKVGNRERIGIVSDLLPEELYDDTYIVKRVLDLSKNHTRDLIYCAAVALQNNTNEPDEELLEALRWVDDEFLTNILEVSISNIDVTNFLKSIILIVGTKSLMTMESQSKEMSQ
ncbi:hypothetical protein [Sphingobacterium faecium]|uniref:hypothetical protein n=1 Tax=Sphingobacterium faecium TaxID=34087 RepID=UPI00247AE5DD|nr:hypothetical protein [Sphingobacterium faecium]WGQ15573.1 hypothetical protein QG727_03995 [Sphingobacterium faecium]